MSFISFAATCWRAIRPARLWCKTPSPTLLMAALLGVGAVLGLVGRADAGGLWLSCYSSSIKPDVFVEHRTGATEGYDPLYDASFSAASSPAIDFYSKTSILGHEKLTLDAREPQNMSTINVEISGRGVDSLGADLGFQFYDIGEDNFVGKNIFADLYDSSHSLLGTYNVKDLAASGDIIPITVNNGLSYYMDVRFTPEPATLALLGLGAASLIAGGRRKRRRAE